MQHLQGDADYRFLNPVIESLTRLGGAATPKDVLADLLAHITLSESERNKTLKGGDNAIRNEIAWARWILVLIGRVDRSERGIWKLVPGPQGPVDIEEAKRQVNEYNRARAAARPKKEKESSPLPNEAPPPDDNSDDQEATFIEVLRSLSPSGFERLCQRLLREAGFTEVHVTGKSGDGGIDGHGILQLNELVSFRVVFQCKRYAGTVGPDKVRDFRGGMDARTDKGILITTGAFTSAAEEEAARPGAHPIELVGSERLVALMERLQLGVRPRTVYDVDRQFFKEFES